MIWAYLIHLSYNMWCDREVPELNAKYYGAKPYLRCDRGAWDELLPQMAAAGFNMVVIDLGDGVRWNSHPEIAVENAWSIADLRKELDRARRLGLEPIPKLNFSACHDAWLGPYSRCLSTETYYKVCSDLIREACEIFDKPRLFHIGMDEENLSDQKYFNYVVIRQYDLWWNDLNFFVREVERSGARAWMWSDYYWANPKAFLDNMSHSVLQSNWYYGMDFKRETKEVAAYLDLEAHGFEQVPAAANWTDAGNFEATVEFCTKSIAPERLAGFMQTVWRPTLVECKDRHDEAIAVAGKAIQRFKG